MAVKFTWHEKFTRTLEKVPEEYRGILALAIINYGTYGLEPEFSEWGLIAAFEGVREDIDNSVNARNKNGGGRPPKTVVEDKENGGLANEKPTFNEQPNGGLDKQKPPLEKDVTQTIPNQSIPVQTKPNHKESSRFAPPSVEEVRKFCAEKGYSVDAERFVAFYESKGWKVGRNPMKSWRASCVTWHKRNAEKGGSSNEEFSEYAGAF